VANTCVLPKLAIHGARGSVVINGMNDFGTLSGSQTPEFPGNPTGQAYFDPSQPVNVVAVGSPHYTWRSLWGRGSVIDRRVSRPRELSKPKAIPGVPIIWEFREVH